MGCACRGGARAGATTSAGVTITGFEITYPDGKTETVLTALEARKEIRRAGGGTVRQLTSSS